MFNLLVKEEASYPGMDHIDACSSISGDVGRKHLQIVLLEHKADGGEKAGISNTAYTDLSVSPTNVEDYIRRCPCAENGWIFGPCKHRVRALQLQYPYKCFSPLDQ